MIIMLNKKILFLIAQENFRDEEYLIPKAILEKQGIKVTTVSLKKQESIGMLGAKVMPDLAVKDVIVNSFDMLVVAGGNGSPKMADFMQIIEMIKKFDYLHRPIAAICLAGYVLAMAGILTNVRATVFPAEKAVNEYKMRGVKYVEGPLVVDGRIITADGPEQAKAFGNEIVTLLGRL